MTEETLPIEVAKFWANRRGEAVIASLREYKGALVIDVRKHFTADDGRLRPTAKGVALAVGKLPALAAAINKTLAKARELGLLPDEGQP